MNSLEWIAIQATIVTVVAITLYATCRFVTRNVQSPVGCNTAESPWVELLLQQRFGATLQEHHAECKLLLHMHVASSLQISAMNSDGMIQTTNPLYPVAVHPEVLHPIIDPVDVAQHCLTEEKSKSVLHVTFQRTSLSPSTAGTVEWASATDSDRDEVPPPPRVASNPTKNKVRFVDDDTDSGGEVELRHEPFEGQKDDEDEGTAEKDRHRQSEFSACSPSKVEEGNAESSLELMAPSFLEVAATHHELCTPVELIVATTPRDVCEKKVVLCVDVIAVTEPDGAKKEHYRQCELSCHSHCSLSKVSSGHSPCSLPRAVERNSGSSIELTAPSFLEVAATHHELCTPVELIVATTLRDVCEKKVVLCVDVLAVTEPDGAKKEQQPHHLVVPLEPLLRPRKFKVSK